MPLRALITGLLTALLLCVSPAATACEVSCALMTSHAGLTCHSAESSAMPGMDAATQAAAHIPCGHHLCVQQPAFTPANTHTASTPVQAALAVRTLAPAQLPTNRLILKLSHHPPAPPVSLPANLRV